MRTRYFVAAAFFHAALLTAASAAAGEAHWGDQAEVSFVDTSGNSEVTTLSARNALSLEFSKKTKAVWKLAALYGESAGVRSAESFGSELRLDRLVTPILYGALLAGWFKDSFAGVDQRLHGGPLAGVNLAPSPRQSLSVEAGVEYVSERYTDETSRDFTQGRAFARYEFALTPKSAFSQSVEYLHGFEKDTSYRLNLMTAVVATLTDVLSLKVSYEIKYTDAPVPETLEKTDSVLSTALLVTF